MKRDTQPITEFVNSVEAHLRRALTPLEIALAVRGFDRARSALEIAADFEYANRPCANDSGDHATPDQNRQLRPLDG